MNVVKQILIVIDIPILLYMLYYVFTIIFLFSKSRRMKNHDKVCKFAIIIPARNEEKVIANLIQSLKRQNYPKNLYQIFVICNNCSDNTEKVVHSEGAEAIICTEKVTSKGDALKYAFNYLNPKNFDAYIIFDADNIVHPDFLSKSNDAILEGASIAQGYRDSKNPYDNWISSCYSLHYWIQNIFLNQSRYNINWSSMINGTGVVITKKIIEKYGYNAETITEDIELSVQCTINNEKIKFIKEAITYDEQVTNLKESLRQRLRWSIGTMQCLEKYGKNLIKTKNFISIDMLFFLLAPLVQVIGTLSGIAHLIIELISKTPINIVDKSISLFACYLASIAVSIIALKMSNKQIIKNAKGILLYPVFLFTWIPLNAIALFKRKYRWKQIQHTKVVSIDKLLEVCTK